MLSVNISYHFNSSDYPVLKSSAAFHLGKLAPTIRMELLARWCGFTTLASFRAALKAAKSEDIYLTLDHQRARNFALAQECTFDALACHHVLATAARVKVAEAYPNLNRDGYGRGSVYVSDADRRTIRESVSAAEYGTAIFDLSEKRFQDGRKVLLTVGPSDEFIRALALCSALTPSRTINRKASSYNFKHRAEERSYRLTGDAILIRDYVSNASFIAAGFYAGFRTDTSRHKGYHSDPNVFFNISQHSLKDVIERAPRE